MCGYLLAAFGTIKQQWAQMVSKSFVPFSWSLIVFALAGSQ